LVERTSIGIIVRIDQNVDLPTPKPRKLHIDVEPPVEVEIDGRRVRFVGVTLLRPHVMIEYEIAPPLETGSPFGPHLVILDVTDDTSDELSERFRRSRTTSARDGWSLTSAPGLPIIHSG
jgi:hypothetical protein